MPRRATSTILVTVEGLSGTYQSARRLPPPKSSDAASKRNTEFAVEFVPIYVPESSWTKGKERLIPAEALPTCSNTVASPFGKKRTSAQFPMTVNLPPVIAIEKSAGKAGTFAEHFNCPPHIVNAAFIGVGAEVLQHTLENQGIYVSAGSACSSHKRAGSPTLTAIDAPREEMESSVRFSFAENNTEDEVDEALAYLKQMLPMLRRYRRK